MDRRKKRQHDDQQRKIQYGKPYPLGKPGYFSNKFQEMLNNFNVAMQVECKGYALLCCIASTEDSMRYRQAILYTDEQLRPKLNIDEHALVRVRQKCVDANWLHFEPGWKGTPSRYWTTVPVQHQGDGLWCGMRTETAIESRTETAIESRTETAIGTRSSYFPSPVPNLTLALPPWEQAEAAVRDAGVEFWRHAVSKCRKHGLGPQDVLDLVAWWRGHQAEFSRPSGALCFALRNAGPEHRGAWGTSFPRNPTAEALQRRLQGHAEAPLRSDREPVESREKENLLRQLEINFDLKAKSIEQVLTMFSLPDNLQIHLREYQGTWGHMRNLGLKHRVAEYLKPQLTNSN